MNKQVRWIFCLTLILTGFQNCAPSHMGFNTTQSLSSNNNGAGNVSEALMASKFSETLHPVVLNRCSACHSTIQIPMFAASDSTTAMRTILNNQLVNLNLPQNSRLVQKVLSGHNSFPATYANELQDAIQAWNDAIASATNPSGDTILPDVMVNTPSSNAMVSGLVQIQAIASDNTGVVGVQFLIDGSPLGTEDSAAPYMAEWNTTALTNKSYSITARARDAAGNIRTSSVISVTTHNASTDTQAPAVTLTAPTNNATFTMGNITISANASDNVKVVGVQFLVDGIALGLEDTVPPYSIIVPSASLTNGSRILTAQARDAAGNQTTSGSRTITVNNPTTANPNANYAWIAANVLPKCTACHSGAEPPKGVLYISYAETLKTVTAGNPNTSKFYNFTKPGGSMPPNNPLSTVEIQAISDWILGGALNN